jgi:hypothetical protein
LVAVQASDPTVSRTATRHIPIPHPISSIETPFQRWRNSPSEDEASVEAIKRTNLTFKYDDSTGNSDPDSSMVSEEILGQDSVASSIRSCSSSMSSRLSAMSSLSLGSHNSRRRRKGRRRLSSFRSYVSEEGIFVKIDCHRCETIITSPISTTWEDGESITEKVDCPKCSRNLFKCDLFEETIRTSVVCPTCDYQVDQVRLLQLRFPDEHAFNCHRCGKHLYTIIIGNGPALSTVLTTSRQEVRADGRRELLHLYHTKRFECTFCPTVFPYKYSWERHETSVHSQQTLWTCMAKGPTIITDLGPACVFCNLSNPTHDHLANHHNYAPCLQRNFSERTFERKDGLQQHLKGVHNQNFISPHMLEHWSQNGMATAQQWACGICTKDFNDWNTRLKHIGYHWDEGLGMKDWVHGDPFREIRTDHHAAPSTEAGQQQRIMRIPVSPQPETTPEMGCPGGWSPAASIADGEQIPLLTHDVLSANSSFASTKSAATVRPVFPVSKPVSRPTAAFVWKDLFGHFSRGRKKSF